MDNRNEADVTLGATNDTASTSNDSSTEARHHLNSIRTGYTPETNTTGTTFGSAFDAAVAASRRHMADLDRRLYDHALQGYYTVPSNVFAKSCPTCDEIAMEKTDTDFVPRYPVGWELVACRRHAAALKTSQSGKEFRVGGVPEARSKAARRYYCQRRIALDAEKTAEKNIATATAAAATTTTETAAPATTTPSAQVSSPNTSLTPPPPDTTTAEKDPCPICVEGTPNLTLDCTHSFCTPCLTTWQQNSTDSKLSSWVQNNEVIQRCYPILVANLKSRFTCPMCRTWLQYTHQSRRKRKLRNKVMRGEEIEEGEVESARLRRGGREGRKRRARMERERHREGDVCQEAPASMPVVQRAQYDDTEQRLHSARRSRRMRAGR